MGGMAAFIPSRTDANINAVAFTKVKEDKLREATDGCDGTWVAHPDLVPLATEVFDEVLGDRPNQIDRLRPDVTVTASDLTEFVVDGGTITDDGVRRNIDIAIRYIASWLEVLRSDKRAIFTAASKAQEIADWMNARQANAHRHEVRGAA